MKKFIFALLVGTAAASAARAQTNASDTPPAPAPAKALTAADVDPEANTSHNTGFGFKAGYSTTSLSGNGTGAFPNLQKYQSFHFGAYGQYGISKFASVQVELLYNRKGYQTTLGNSSDYPVRLDYIDIPVLFVGNITPNFSFHVGPQVSFLANVDRDGTNLRLGSNYNAVNFGGVGGLEGRFGNARLGARYDMSLVKLYQYKANVQYNNAAVYLSNNNMYTRTVEVYLSYGFSQ